MTIFESPLDPIEPRDLSITERVFEGLDLDPEAVVLIDGPSGRQMTAGALRSAVQSLAGGLNARGLGQGQVTAIMLPNLPEYALAFHGVAYAGGTVTTINPTYKAEEVRHQLVDSGARLSITIPAFLETAREGAQDTGVTEIAVIGDTDGALPFADLMGAPQGAQTPVDLGGHTVALPYSSGTTGLPKGVMLSHRNLVTNIDQTVPCMGPASGDTTVAFLPFFHIYGMTVLMNLYLALGGCLVTMPRFDLEEFLKLVQQHRAKQIYIVPPVALALAKHPMVDQFDLSSLDRIISAAAPLGADTCVAIRDRLGCEVAQGYGMTELSPVSHASPLGTCRDGASGRTIPNTLCRVVSPEGADLGAGEEGELWVKGPQVMQGYLNNPDATAESIVEDGWLRTGDLVEFDEDGFIYLKDRVKELIKVKGFQVAPAEVEAVLNAHPGIADAAVIGIPDEEAGERPRAFVVAAEGQEIGAEEVIDHLNVHLSSYKVPDEVTFVEAIPKSASGKILRRLLRDGAA